MADRVRSLERAGMSVLVFADAGSASRAAAGMIRRAVDTACAARGRAVLGLATGSTTQKVYESLVAMHRAGELSFRDVITYNLDEYYPIQPLDPKSYRTYMHRNLFSLVNLSPHHTHVLDGTVPEPFVAEHCAEFDRWIEADGGLDLQLLGIGRNGHIGFNEPSDRPVAEALALATRLVELHPVTRSDAAPGVRQRRPGHSPRSHNGSGLDPGRAIDPDAGHRRPQGRGRCECSEFADDRRAAGVAAPVGRRPRHLDTRRTGREPALIWFHRRYGPHWAARARSVPGEFPMVPLNEYEARQADEIAAWKSERPSLVMAAFRGIGRPLSHLLARIVPDETVRSLAAKAEAMSKSFVGPPEIACKAGLKDLSELRSWTLEECDALAATISATAERRAILEGAIAGLGGIVTATLNVPILLAATQRSIFRIGHCYGFPLDSEIDRLFVLGILELSTADDPARRQAVFHQLRDLGTDPATLPPDGKAIPLDGLEETLLQDLAFGAVPLVGDLTWIPMNHDLIRRVDITARRVFQERWLRDRGKVTEIFPAPESRMRSSLQGGIDLVAQLCYAGSYGIAFGVTVPLALAAWGVSSFENPVARGARRGTALAVRDADRFLARLRASRSSRFAEPPSAAPEPPAFSVVPAA